MCCGFNEEEKTEVPEADRGRSWSLVSLTGGTEPGKAMDLAGWRPAMRNHCSVLSMQDMFKGPGRHQPNVQALESFTHSAQSL